MPTTRRRPRPATVMPGRSRRVRPIKQPADQLSFGALTREADWPPPKCLGKPGKVATRKPDELAEFGRRLRLAGFKETTVKAKSQQLWVLLRQAVKITGRPITIRELFADVRLLAAAASIDDGLQEPDRKVSIRSLASRRSCAKSFMRQMEDYLDGNAERCLERFNAELLEYFPPVGLMRYSRNGNHEVRRRFTPSEDDMEKLLCFLGGHKRAYSAQRDVAFVLLLSATGLRLSSAIGIKGEDFRHTQHGLTVFVREKCRNEEEEHIIPAAVEAALSRYIRAFNTYAAECGTAARVGFGFPGLFWRSRTENAWASYAAQSLIARASKAACAEQFFPHAIRRFWARTLAKDFPRELVADAIGWKNKAVLDRHYAHGPGEAKSWNDQPVEGGDTANERPDQTAA